MTAPSTQQAAGPWIDYRIAMLRKRWSEGASATVIAAEGVPLRAAGQSDLCRDGDLLRRRWDARQGRGFFDPMRNERRKAIMSDLWRQQVPGTDLRSIGTSSSVPGIDTARDPPAQDSAGGDRSWSGGHESRENCGLTLTLGQGPRRGHAWWVNEMNDVNQTNSTSTAMVPVDDTALAVTDNWLAGYPCGLPQWLIRRPITLAEGRRRSRPSPAAHHVRRARAADRSALRTTP